MKFKVTMKDPDTLHDAINDALDGNKPEGITDSEWEQLREGRHEDISEIASKWFEYGEYVTVEIDTEAKTCVVVEV